MDGTNILYGVNIDDFVNLATPLVNWIRYAAESIEDEAWYCPFEIEKIIHAMCLRDGSSPNGPRRLFLWLPITESDRDVEFTLGFVRRQPHYENFVSAWDDWGYDIDKGPLGGGYRFQMCVPTDCASDGDVAKLLSAIESRMKSRFPDVAVICHVPDHKPQSTGTGCYIATAVYGSYDCPEVWTLRRFRDQWLAESALGRAFIRCYYALSPSMVRHFGKSTAFRRFFRKPLDRLVARLRSEGFESTPYWDK